SALVGTASVLVAASLRKSSRHYLAPRNIVDGLVAGARNTVSVALACGCAGIVIGVITLTGLGLEFTGVVLALSQNYLVLALVLTAIAGIILGMGMPTTPAYIVQVALLVPALVKLGIVLEAAHMFTFYFAILSAITPPVALAVYAANGLSNAGLWDTGLAAVKLGATGYIVPFMFVFGPALLMIGEPFSIVLAASTAVIGVVCLAASLAGYLLAVLPMWQRFALFGAAILLIKPGIYTDLAGIAIVAVVASLNLMLKDRTASDTA
ncbi:MAG TPA: TRAP transporter large permease subunit, partial [Thalassobaculum sp.]